MKTQTIATFLLLGLLTGTMETKTQAASINDPDLAISTVVIKLPATKSSPCRFWINYRHQMLIEDGVPYANHCDVRDGYATNVIDISMAQYDQGQAVSKSNYSYIEIQKQKAIGPNMEEVFTCPLATINFSTGDINYDEGSWKVNVTPSQHDGLNDYEITPVE